MVRGGRHVNALGSGLCRQPWLLSSAVAARRDAGNQVSVHLERAGYGTLLTLTDGPFDLRVPGVLRHGAPRTWPSLTDGSRRQERRTRRRRLRRTERLNRSQ